MSIDGIKTSIEGKNATDATAEETTLDTEFGSPKIRTDASPAHYGIVTPRFASNPGAVTVNLLTIDHGLGFTPATIMNWSNEARDHYGSGRLDLDVFGLSHYIAYADNKQFKIDFVNTDIANGADPSTTNYTLRYYIFSESGA